MDDKITFSEEEHTAFDENVESVYVENSVTMSFPHQDGVHMFSRTFKRGISVSVPPGQTYEATNRWARLQIENDLRKQYQTAMYKKQDITK